MTAQILFGLGRSTSQFLDYVLNGNICHSVMLQSDINFTINEKAAENLVLS